MPSATLRAVIPRIALPFAFAALAALALALSLYDLLAASLTVALAAASLAAVARRPRTAFLSFAAVGAVLLGLAFGTAAGTFWLNVHRFAAILAELDAAPGLDSLQLGTEDRMRRADGTWRSYDAYRFVNGMVVTHHVAQVAPHAAQPVLAVEDVLRAAGVSPDAYRRLRARLERLSLGGFHRRGDGVIALMEPRPGGSPWMTGFVFSPSGRTPEMEGIETFTRLSPRWFHLRTAL